MGQHPQVVQRDDGANERAQINDEHLVVRLHAEASLSLRDLRPGPILALDGPIEHRRREEIEDILEVVKDLMVDGHLPLKNLGEVVSDVNEPRVKTSEGRQLGRHARGEGESRGGEERGRRRAEKVLNTNLLGLLGLDERRDMHEGLLGRGAVLWKGYE